MHKIAASSTNFIQWRPFRRQVRTALAPHCTWANASSTTWHPTANNLHIPRIYAIHC